MNKKILKNYFFNLSYQLLNICMPLITTPYVARVLGADGVGRYSYTQSVVTFLFLIGSLGTAMYGQREVAYAGNNKEKRSRIFWEILLLRTLALGIVLLFFITLIIPFSKYRLLYLIQIIDIIAVLCDISWFFQGIEEFGKTVFRNAIIKLLTVCLVFLLVKSADDLPIYIICMSLPILIGNLSIWLYLPNYIILIKIFNLHCFKHLKNALMLFLPQIAIQLYTVLDKTMLNWLGHNEFENGYYEQAQKIIRVSLAIVTALGPVMASRIAYTYNNEQKSNSSIRKYMQKSVTFVWAIGLPATLGLVAIADMFVPIFYGTGYDRVIILIKLMSLLNVIIGISNVIGVQYLVPTNQQNVLTVSVLLGAAVNILLNTVLIPYYQSLGAAIATVIAEFCVTVVQIGYIRCKISIKIFEKKYYKYVFSSLIMVCLLMYLSQRVSGIYGVLTLLFSGISVYFFILLLLREENIINQLRRIKNSKERKV